MCAYTCMCVCVCVHAASLLMADMVTYTVSSACLMMWLMAAHLSLIMWWRPGGVRGPLCWSCKPTMGIHHAYTSYNALGGACTWTWSFDQGRSKVFKTGQARFNPEHYVIKCVDR